MATVGYGDVVPTTDAGMIVAGFTVIFSIVAYSILVAIVAEQFCLLWLGRLWGWRG